jgi:hypothetical protein
MWTSRSALLASVEGYLQSLLDVIQQYSVRRDAIDWPALRAEVMEAAGLTRSSPDVTAAIEIALRLLGDYESFYMSRERRLIGVSPAGACVDPPAAQMQVPDTVGHVKLGGCPCASGADIARFAETIGRLKGLFSPRST